MQKTEGKKEKRVLREISPIEWDAIPIPSSTELNFMLKSLSASQCRSFLESPLRSIFGSTVLISSSFIFTWSMILLMVVELLVCYVSCPRHKDASPFFLKKTWMLAAT